MRRKILISLATIVLIFSVYGCGYVPPSEMVPTEEQEIKDTLPSASEPVSEPTPSPDLPVSDDLSQIEQKIEIEIQPALDNTDTELHIKELVRSYLNAKLAGDENELSGLVTNSALLNMDSIRKKNEYIEEYRNCSYLIYSCPDSVTEFDYIVCVAYELKIWDINTPAPGAEEYMIVVDENNYPYIFLGTISEESNAYVEGIRASEEYLTFVETKSTQPFLEALSTDPELLKFLEELIEQNQ